MSRRAALLCGAAVAAPVVWTVAASAAAIAWMGLWNAFPYPSTQWFDYLPYWQDNRRIGQSLLFGACAATMGLMAAGRGLWDLTQGKEPLHGKSGWLTRREAKKGGFSFSFKPRADAILVGRKGWGPFRRYVGLPGEEHVALTAKTRSGKGVSFVVPNVLTWGGSVVCFSVKRDIFDAAAGARVARGDEVSVFDLSDPERRTHRWNPLSYVRRNEAETYGDIYRAMWFLVPETKANNPFWDNAARKLASAIGVILAETPGARLNVAEVLHMVQRPDWAENLQAMIVAARRASRPYSRSAVDVVMKLVPRKDEKEAQDVISTLATALGLWDDPVVAALTSESDFDLGALRSRRMTVFVCGGPADIRIYRPIYGLLFQQLVQLNTRLEYGRDASHIHRVLGMLDEFWALGKQDVLADASAFTASYGFRWGYVQQNMEQSVSAFGKEGARNIFSNTGARLAFGGMEMDEAKEISEWAADNTVQEITRSRPRWQPLAINRHSESEAIRRRRLILPQDVRRLDEGKLLVRRGRLHLLKLDRVVYWRDRVFKRMLLPSPEFARISIEVKRDDGASGAVAAKPAWAPLP